jgi:hypothetical protein
MPESVTTIGPYAFAYCDDLTNIILSHSLMLIDDGTFYACSNLPSIVIPAAVTSIGTGAFFECTDLINVFFTGDAPILADAVFGYDTNATAYYIDGSTGWSEFTESSGIPAVLWNPVIQTNDGNFGVQNGQFGFAVTGTADIPVVIEACTNLTSPIWIPLRSLKLTNGLFYFSEPFQPNSVPRFYRISSP